MKEKKEPDKKPIEKFVLRIDKNLKDLANEEAKKSNRSFNGHLITLIEDDLKEKGILKKK